MRWAWLLPDLALLGGKLAGADRRPSLSSQYEKLLERNSAKWPSTWRSFARRDDPYPTEADSWSALAYGYKVAADILAKECYDNFPHRDILYSPIFFLYRHYVEVELKATCYAYFERGWLDRPPTHDSHRISPLWKTFREASIAKGLIAADDEFVESISKSILLFNEIDGTSTYSRYPTVRNKYHRIHVDVNEIICAVEDFETLFFGLSVMMDQ